MTTLPQDSLDWLKLKLIPNMGSVMFSRLLRRFGAPGRVFSASHGELLEIKGMGQAMVEDISRRNFVSSPEKNAAALARLNARMLTINDDEYPPLLRHIHAPPPLLFVQGDLRPCHGPAIAIVGARKFTPYGRKVAEELAMELGRAGVAVVSGLARGIDTMAHQGALAAPGYTVGVLACSLDYAYPPENRQLISEVAEKGAVVSEYLIDTPPKPGLFPVRNRIISGLCSATVVVEANLRSGSLITARHALDQGREVFAVPGPVSSTVSRGCHELLRQGATLLSNIDDLYEAGIIAGGNRNTQMPLLRVPLAAQMRQSSEQAGLTLPAEGKIILDLLGVEPTHVDDIIRQSGLAAQAVTALLVDLELEGLVDQIAGRNYIKL